MPKSKGIPYEVGKGRPPKASQFKKGQSGCPSGRPKGAVSLATDVKAELRASVTVTQNGREVTLTQQRLLVKSVLTRAVKGDRHATALMIDMIARTIGVTDQSEGQEQTLSAEDQDVLDAFEAELADRLGTTRHG